MKPADLFTEIRNYCIQNADPDIVKKYSRYFREGYDAYGLTDKLLHDKAAEILEDRSIDLKFILDTGKLLIPTGKYEETSFAIVMLKLFTDQFTPETFSEIGKWFEIGIINWAHTDGICGSLISTFFENNLITLESFSDWRTAQNKFQRRAVPVSMLSLLKTTEEYTELFDFIDPIMMDNERVVHQGLGWFLREAWKLKRTDTEVFLLKWKNDAPRLIYQAATEKMTPEEKKRFKKDKIKLDKK